MRPTRRALYRKGKEFVEVETGRGSTTAKLTTNPNTAYTLGLQVADSNNMLPRGPRSILYKGGIMFWHGKKAKHKIVYLGTGKDAVMVHESAHVAYLRIRRKSKQRVIALANEVFASSFQLEWMKKENKNEYEEKMKHSTPKALIIGHILEAKLTKNRWWGWSKAGFGIAREIQKKFSEEERKQIREKLLKGKYTPNEIYGYFTGLLSEEKKSNAK